MSLSVRLNFYYNTDMKSFPEIIPVFPLSGVIYFPKTNLPLNIFERRYLDLVNDTFKGDKLMGMVQSQKSGNEVYKVGCLGKISDFQKSKDGRILINLTGITRFKIIGEIENRKLSPLSSVICELIFFMLFISYKLFSNNIDFKLKFE